MLRHWKCDVNTFPAAEDCFTQITFKQFVKLIETKPINVCSCCTSGLDL